MDIILWIVLGGLAGWIADMIMGSGRGVIEDILLGVIGAFVGGFIMNTFNQPGVAGFNFYSLAVAVIGAVVLIFLGRFFRRQQQTGFFRRGR